MMRRGFIVLSPFIFYIFLFSCTVAQRLPDTVKFIHDTTEISLLFAGDVMGHMPQISSAYDSSTGKYDFNPVFSLVKQNISNADIAVANLETTLAGPPFSGYPQFSAPDSLAAALKNAGFDILITANNHCLDRGSQGLERTVEMLDSFKILRTGTFINDSLRNIEYPLFVTVKGIKLAILNYTYGTNGLQVRKPNVVNYIDTAQIRKDINKAKAQKAEYIITTIHWGIEYQNKENAEQQNIANFLLNTGTDLVIGSHPHVVQPVEKRYNTADSSQFNIVVYSLGNYVSNQRDRYKDGGIMFNLKLQKTDKVRLIDYTCTPSWVFKGTLDNKLQYKIIPVVNDSTSLPEWLDNESRSNAIRFFNDTKGLLSNVPISEN
jgi:poly-gamma-glutamate synthesis protein (capsule biosynthesis protein)